MNSHEPSKRPRNFKAAALPAASLLIFVALSALGIASGTARSPQDPQAAPTPEGREFKNTVPGHAPVKVKIRNEKSFKDKENKNWARELEIEVKNTGDKPIYHLYFVLSMPDVTQGGVPFAFQLTYGRRELWLRETEITPEDVPILPGETVTLTIPERFVKAYEGLRDKEKLYEDSQKVEFLLQGVDFGDGTALRYTDGTLVHRAPKKVSANGPRPKQRAASEDAASPPSSAAKSGCSPSPAKFSRVNFFKLAGFTAPAVSRRATSTAARIRAPASS